MNSKRKRTPEEQTAFDEIESFKRGLKGEKELRGIRADALLAAPSSSTSDAVHDLFKIYASSRDLVAAMEAKLRDMEAAYKALRERGGA